MVEVDGHLHVQVQEDKCQRAIFSMLRRLDLNVKHLVNDSAFHTNIGTLRKLQPAHVLTILFVHSTIKIYFLLILSGLWLALTPIKIAFGKRFTLLFISVTPNCVVFVVS